MGALLQRIGIQGKPSQALVKAPSADLIRSDNEFSPPEPEEIKLEIDREKLENYEQISNTYGFAKQVVAREKLLHFLKSKDFKVYDRLKVDSFMERYIAHASENLKLGNDLWWQWIELKDYKHPLPIRIADNPKTISDFSRNAVFFISDIVQVTNRQHYNFQNTDKYILEHKTIPMKRKTEICFLKVNASVGALSEECIIIDAWRGPTFSDEEAKI